MPLSFGSGLKGGTMTEPREPAFTFQQRLGNTNYTVSAFIDDKAKESYQDILLNLIRRDIQNQQTANDDGNAA